MDYEPIDEYRSNIKERLASIETILHRELPDIKEQLKISNGRTRSVKLINYLFQCQVTDY